MIRLVVFDWDGTLMDSESRIITAMQRAFAAAGVAVPPNAAVRDIIGLDLAVAVMRLAPGRPAEQRSVIVNDYRQHYALLHAIPSPLFEDAQATLSNLTAAGYLLAIATGKSRRGLDHALDESGVGAFFATTRCGEEAAPKPDPAMLRDILWDLDISPAQTLMVGDTEFDLRMAEAARTHAAAVTYGAHPRQRLVALNPAIVIDALAELPAAIARLNDTTSS